jgi:GNAT superfamily N-acetyltransferase
MFAEMESLSEEQSAALMSATVPWIRELLGGVQYGGYFLEQDGVVVAGGGLHLSEIGPVKGCFRVGRRGHIANMNTVPAHRRRGIARRLMEEIVSWSQRNGVDQLTLDASIDGRRLYEALGFSGTSTVRKTL